MDGYTDMFLYTQRTKFIIFNFFSKLYNFIKFIIFFKTESYGIIHTFKNYFTTLFSVFSNKWYPIKF